MVRSSFTPHHNDVLPERDLSICVAEKAMVRSSFLTQPAAGQQEEAKRHGGSRSIMLQPPVFLLFDDPAGAHGTQEDERVVAGRIAKIRSAS